MKRFIKVKLPKINILKESPEERKIRVKQAGSAMITKIVPNKRKLPAKKQRQQDKNICKNYED